MVLFGFVKKEMASKEKKRVHPGDEEEECIKKEAGAKKTKVSGHTFPLSVKFW